MKNKASIAIIVFALLAVGLACSFTTAKIDNLAFGKNEKADPPTTSFDQSDKIFAVANVSGAIGKHKMKFKVTYEDVDGKKKGDEAISKEIDFEGNAAPYLSLTVPAGGTYKVQATLVGEDGKDIDTKSGTVTVKGAPAQKVTNDDKSDDPDDDND